MANLRWHLLILSSRLHSSRTIWWSLDQATSRNLVMPQLVLKTWGRNCSLQTLVVQRVLVMYQWACLDTNQLGDSATLAIQCTVHGLIDSAIHSGPRKQVTLLVHHLHMRCMCFTSSMFLTMNANYAYYHSKLTIDNCSAMCHCVHGLPEHNRPVMAHTLDNKSDVWSYSHPTKKVTLSPCTRTDETRCVNHLVPITCDDMKHECG